jgi:hypothetical protein
VKHFQINGPVDGGHFVLSGQLLGPGGLKKATQKLTATLMRPQHMCFCDICRLLNPRDTAPIEFDNEELEVEKAEMHESEIPLGWMFNH